MDFYKSKNTKFENQKDAILETIDKAQLNRMAIPNGYKEKIKKVCEEKYPNLFQKTSFEEAWKKGTSKYWQTQYHDGYAKRGAKIHS